MMVQFIPRVPLCTERRKKHSSNKSFVQYRDSTLTWLLREALG
eukprot:gene9126-biopygen6413